MLKIRDRILEFRRVEARDLVPHACNWRRHPPRQRDAMRGVLEEIGYAGALLARRRDDGALELIDGHLRAETTPDQKVPVLVLDLSESESRTLLATHDPLTAMADTDDAALARLLVDLESENPAVDRLLAQLRQDLVPLSPARITDADHEPTGDDLSDFDVQSGDLWEIGDHRLYCGDATDPDAVRTLVGHKTPLLMVTDPPYGVSYDPVWRTRHDGSRGTRNGKVANDDRSNWAAAFAHFRGPVAYVWHASRFTGHVQQQLESCGLQTRAQIIWGKTHFTLSRGDYHWQHEPCWYGVRRGCQSNWQGDRTQTTLWQFPSLSPFGRRSDETLTKHGTQKPVECMARPMRNNTAPGETVYDPFVGSGTTMVAAQQLGRVCFAMELVPAYCRIVLRRMADLGCRPRLASASAAQKAGS